MSNYTNPDYVPPCFGYKVRCLCRCIWRRLCKGKYEGKTPQQEKLPKRLSEGDWGYVLK